MSGYNQFCPMAMAAELLCKRWNLIILRELHLGSTHFNELRRGIPKISPTLLSLRLKELKSAGIIEGTTILNGKAASSYSLTKSGKETFDVILALGNWGQNWFEQRAITGNSEPELLMWDLQRNIFCDQLPQRNLVLQFIFSNEKQYPKWWILFEPSSSIDLGHTDPGFDPDIICETDVEALTNLHMGFESLASLLKQNAIDVSGSNDVINSMPNWLGTSHFAKASG